MHLALTVARLSVWAMLAGLLRGQSASGSLRGMVEDASGARIAGASIAIQMPDAGPNRRIQSDASGRFLIEELPSGAYGIMVTAPGFAVASSDVTIGVGTRRELVIRLTPSSDAQSVTVQGTGSSVTEQLMDFSTNVHGTVITRRDLTSLPLPARSFANIAYLSPGTEPVEPSDPTKARVTAVSTGGSSGLNNELSVDGGDNSDDYIGGFLQNYSPDAIEEFAVRTSQEDADTGGTTAGSVVIVTRSGTNTLHGEGSFFDRASALNARFPIENPAPNPKQPFSQQHYVGTVGGAIRKDHLWFFGGVEYVHEDASIVYSPASVIQFDALAALARYGLIPGVQSIPVPANVAIPFRDTLGLLRLDWLQRPRASWFLRGAVDTYTTHNNLVQQGALPSTGLLTHNNYLDLVLGNQYEFSPTLIGRFVVSAGGLHLTQERSSNLGFALAFPFSSTSLTVSGFETFGDNQFATPITNFPAERNQQKHQLRYDLSKAQASHSLKFGVNLIHEPVLDGRFAGETETLYQFPQNPAWYLDNLSSFTEDMRARASTSGPGGRFTQNVQRLAFYGMDSWQLNPPLTLNFGVRYSSTWGLLLGSGKSQEANEGYRTLSALKIPLVPGVPGDDRKQIAPRVGFAYAPGSKRLTVIRGGFGLYFGDLAQNGWATALEGLDQTPGSCVDPVQNPGGNENAGCTPGHAMGGQASVIDSVYGTPYAIHVSAGVQRAIGEHWSAAADYVHEQGNHAYRAYQFTGGTNLFTPLLPEGDPRQAEVVPDANIFHSDNRSSYDGLLVHVQGRAGRRLNLVANYTWAKAQTWGCVLGELFDYVNGVCDPLNAFAPGDYGPSGEDVRHRFVLAGYWHTPGGFELSTLTQAETARPFTITSADGTGRISMNGHPESLDQFRGTPYVQVDLRVSRPIQVSERIRITPLIEFFNTFNRNNPGNNFVANVAALPVPPEQAQSGNVTDICVDSSCSATEPLSRTDQLRVPGGALGDFFGPGTTVGIPFAAQIGARISF